MTTIFAGGNQATAIAGIKTAVAGFVTTGTDGAPQLDGPALTNWLRGQFLQMAADGEIDATVGATYDTVLSAASLVDPGSFVTPLSQVYLPSHWSSRADYPVSSAVWTGTEATAAARDGIAELERMSAIVTSVLTDADAHLKDWILDFYSAEEIESTVPDGVIIEERTRYYLHTFVTDKGEESAPSEPSAKLIMDQNDSATVGRAAVPAGRNITHWRVYRSAFADKGGLWRYVKNSADENGYPIATASFTDAALDEDLQEGLQTLGWDEPPADFRGIVAGPNGGGAGFKDNVWMPWVNFAPYAYRPQDWKVLSHPIVAQGVFGNTYVVLTRGIPYFITGPDSGTMASEPRPDGQPCVSEAGVVSMRGDEEGYAGVYYPCPDGICRADPNGFKVITGPEGFNIWDKEQWELLNPSSIIAAELEGAYVFQYDTGTTRGMYMLHVRTGKLVKLTNAGTALYRDPLTDRLYMADGTTIKALMSDAANPRTARWVSKEIMLAEWPSFAWLYAHAKFTANVRVKVHGVRYDGTEVLLRDVYLGNRKPVRMPSKVFDQYRITIESATHLTQLGLATSTADLQQ